MTDVAQSLLGYTCPLSCVVNFVDGKQAGKRAFCAGMDLNQRLDIIKTKEVALEYPQGGFAGMTNRVGKKPIIVACNGHAHGAPSRSPFQ
jgi:hypothetical protein